MKGGECFQFHWADSGLFILQLIVHAHYLWRTATISASSHSNSQQHFASESPLQTRQKLRLRTPLPETWNIPTLWFMHLRESLKIAASEFYSNDGERSFFTVYMMPWSIYKVAWDCVSKIQEAPKKITVLYFVNKIYFFIQTNCLRKFKSYRASFNIVIHVYPLLHNMSVNFVSFCMRTLDGEMWALEEMKLLQVDDDY